MPNFWMNQSLDIIARIDGVLIEGQQVWSLHTQAVLSGGD